MAESEYIKIKREDLREALLAAFDAGWSGTPEVAESIVSTIIAGLTSSIAPSVNEDSILIQKLSSMLGKKNWKDEMYGSFAADMAAVNSSKPKPRPYPSIGMLKEAAEFNPNGMYEAWDAAQ